MTNVVNQKCQKRQDIFFIWSASVQLKESTKTEKIQIYLPKPRNKLRYVPLMVLDPS